MAIATQLRISLLGRVAVAGVGGRAIGEASLASRQNRLLFAYLAAELGKPVSREVLADVLWGAEPPISWEKALTVIASKVRGMLAEAGVDGAALAGAAGCYRLELPEGTWVDVLVAADAVDAATAALRSGDLETAEESAALAESLVRLPFLAGEDGTWVEAKRRELADLHVRALGVLSEACLRAGDSGNAARWAEEAVLLEPFRESGYRSLMEAQVAAGNRAEAFRVYERCRQLLADELGAYPSPETEAIYRWLLEQPGDIGDIVSLGEPLSRPSSRRRIVALAGAGVAVAAIVVGVVALGGRGTPPTIVPNSFARIDPHTLRLFARVNTLTRVDPATNKVTAVIGVGATPTLAAVGGHSVWVYNRGDSTLSEIDAGTSRVRKTTEVPVGVADVSRFAGPVLAADASGAWFVSGGLGGDGPALMRVPVDGRKREYRLDIRPTGVAVGEGAVWVVGRGARDYQVLRIDPATGGVRTRTRFLASTPIESIAFGYGAVWVIDSGHATLYRINAETGKREGGLVVGASLAARPEIMPRGGDIWIRQAGSPGTNGATTRVDPSTLSINQTDPCCSPDSGEDRGDLGALWWYSWQTGSLFRQEVAGGPIREIHITATQPDADGPCLTSIAIGSDSLWLTAASSPDGGETCPPG